MSLDGSYLIASASPDSGSMEFDTPFSGLLSDFENVEGSFTFFSGTAIESSISLSDNLMASATIPALNNGNPIHATLEEHERVPEPGTILGLITSVGLLGVSMLKRKIGDRQAVS